MTKDKENDQDNEDLFGRQRGALQDSECTGGETKKATGSQNLELLEIFISKLFFIKFI